MKLVNKIIDISEAYLRLNIANIDRLKSEGFSEYFSTMITYGTVFAGLVSGSFLVLVPLFANGDLRYYYIIVLVNLLLFISILIQKILHNKQIKKYRGSEEGLIKP